MTTEKANERRQYPRHFVRILVDYSASDTFLYDYSSDLSEGGIFIQTKNPLEKGDQLELRFTIPGKDRIFQVRAEVVWLNKETAEVSQEIDSEEALGDALDDLLDNVVEEPPEEGDKMPEGMGVRFLDLSAEDQEILRGFLTKEHY